MILCMLLPQRIEKGGFPNYHRLLDGISTQVPPLEGPCGKESPLHLEEIG
jgi:hypothetical protein